jgi:plastocyanin
MRLFVGVVLAVFVTLALCGVVAAQQTVVVNVTDTGVNKAEVTVDAGDTVVWANSSAAHVTVFFSGGKEVQLACAAPTRFYLAPDDTYSSGVIPPGAVASLCFAEAGVYQYFVAGTGQRQLVKGAVTVK